jgi:hypothetical protein
MFRFNVVNVVSVALLVVVAGIVIGQAPVTQASVLIGDPNAGNGWSSLSAVSLQDYSGEMDPWVSPGRLALNLINGSGMSGTNGELAANGSPIGVMTMFTKYPDRSGTFGNTNVYGTPNPGTLEASGSHWVRFQFDKVYQLNDVTIWNYNENTYYTQGWKHVAIQVSETGGTSASDWTTIYNAGLDAAPGAGAAPTAASLVASAGGIAAKYVTLINTGLGTEGNYMGDDQFTGLSEVRFSAVVPEPGTLALLATGAIGLLCYAWRKRRS